MIHYGGLTAGVQKRRGPAWCDMTKWPELNFRKQLLYKSMIPNQTHYSKQICFYFCFLGLCSLPSETAMKKDIVERNEKRIDL